MPAIRDFQATFAGGELTPPLHGRIDIQKYKTGLRTARNVNIIPQGGARNRPGTAYIARAGNSASAVRLIPFTASTTVAYIIELGDFYARFYTNDGQVQKTLASAWVTSTPYIVGDYVTQSGTQYYCLVAHTSGTFATDLASGDWVAMTAMQIPTPWAAADLFKIKFAQSADVMYFAHPSYTPKQLTFASSTSWTLATYAFINGPFMVQNSDTTKTITPSALTGSITLAASSAIFDVGQIGGLFQLVSTIVGQTISPSLTASVLNWIPTKATWQAVTTGTWSGTILVQTSPDNITWTTVSTVTSNGTVSGTASFTNGYLRAIMQSALAFSGTATVVLTGNGNTAGPTVLTAVSDATTAVAAGDTVLITLTTLSGTGDTVVLERSDDAGATYTTLATYTTNQAATSVATTKTNCLVRARKTINGGGTPSATVNGTTGAAPTLSVSISTASVSAAIQCGSTWSIITNGTWTGKLRVEISTDGGANWTLVQALASGSTNTNFNVSGSTGVRQCLLRVSADPTVTFTGTASISLTSQSFSWVGIVKITAFSSSTSVTGTVQNLSNTDSTGLANLTATWQWSEGSWSTYRGFPTCVAFYQDRATFASTTAEPNTAWHSKTGSYLDYGTSSPLLATDGFSVVLASRQLNAISIMVPMPQALICLTSDTSFGLAPGSSGIYSATSVTQTPMDHRGAYNVDPVVVGNEIIHLQQMGTVVRNLIFQLAVNGFMGDNVSVNSQHLFTGYTITQMAYQQEPDSLIWMVRSDGVLLSCTYDRAQEMSAWTHHDTLNGTFESVAVIPNSTLGINELWVVVKRGSIRSIEALKPRDQGTTPSAQWFVDGGQQYSGAAATNVTGLLLASGTVVAVYADGNVISNGVTDTSYTVSGSGTLTPALTTAASVITVGIPIVWDIGLLDIETLSPQLSNGILQGRRVKMPRAKIRVWNSRGGYISTTPPGGASGIADNNTPPGSMDEIQDIMARDPATNMDTALPLVTGIADTPLPSGYQYGAAICLRGIDPLPFALLDVLPTVVPGGE